MDVRQAYSVIYQNRLCAMDGFSSRFTTAATISLHNEPVAPQEGNGMGTSNSSRRSFMKLAAATPLLTQIAARNLYAQAATAIGKNPRQNVYSRLGVRTVINCRGTWTYLSGSLEFPEVRQAQVEAAQYFVNMIELQRGAGRRL